MTENKKVQLEDILQAKEERKKRQVDMRQKYGTTIVSITINMPGPVKDRPVVRQLRDYAVAEVTKRLTVNAVWSVNFMTGPEALLSVQEDGNFTKNTCVNIENNHSFGRLLDMDVFDAAGKQISRSDKGQARTCLLCGEKAVLCMRARKHNLSELEEAVVHLLADFSAYQTRHLTNPAEKLGALALEAMLYEVTCTPSPGLVDRVNNGAHRDMDFFTFMSSSASLSMYMARCAQAGFNFTGSLPDLLPVLRQLGRAGEQAMLVATAGVNTQKGLLFCLGIIVAGAGWLIKTGEKLTCETVLAVTVNIVRGIVARELENCRFKPKERQTAGEKLYCEYGITGIRGEMEAGLPAVQEKALPSLKQALAKGLSVNDSLLQTLLVLMTCVDDTTVMHRHDLYKMRVWVRQEVQKALTLGGMYTDDGRAAVWRLDERFIRENVSPGGTADLLAVTWFIYKLEQQFS